MCSQYEFAALSKLMIGRAYELRLNYRACLSKNKGTNRNRRDARVLDAWMYTVGSTSAGSQMANR